MISTSLIKKPINYDGTQLRSHFLRETTGIPGDGIMAFSGTCYVMGENLVDLEDAEASSSIVAQEMLHFICEHFQIPLREMNYRLRLFITIMRETLSELAPQWTITRDGDDLYESGRKISVGIATVSATSALFHCGINIDPEGAPVPAVGLNEFKVRPSELARRVLDAYQAECESIELAVRKVRGV